jgi:hypothetical protein
VRRRVDKLGALDQRSPVRARRLKSSGPSVNAKPSARSVNICVQFNPIAYEPIK